jgi:hypothetical protein
VKILSRHHLSHWATFSKAAFAGGPPQIVASKDLSCRIAVSLPQVVLITNVRQTNTKNENKS